MAARKAKGNKPAAEAGELNPAPRGYTRQEWDHFVAADRVRALQGEAAAQSWLERHPAPVEIAEWIVGLERERKRLAHPGR